MRFGPFDPTKFPPRLPRFVRPAARQPLLVELHARYVGEATTGLWCDTCALPSAWACDVEMRLNCPSAPDGPSATRRGTITACTDCGTVTLSQRGAQ